VQVISSAQDAVKVDAAKKRANNNVLFSGQLVPRSRIKNKNKKGNTLSFPSCPLTRSSPHLFYLVFFWAFPPVRPITTVAGNGTKRKDGLEKASKREGKWNKTPCRLECGKKTYTRRPKTTQDDPAIPEPKV
jgi:hypothetical protein